MLLLFISTPIGSAAGSPSPSLSRREANLQPGPDERYFECSDALHPKLYCRSETNIFVKTLSMDFARVMGLPNQQIDDAPVYLEAYSEQGKTR
ncbi:hypothetical protein PtB15_7B436 [Puccinia triticina]|nr:hypothetical protein PtB15_7B436 [Puccinia triticina]